MHERKSDAVGRRKPSVRQIKAVTTKRLRDPKRKKGSRDRVNNGEELPINGIRDATVCLALLQIVDPRVISGGGEGRGGGKQAQQRMKVTCLRARSLILVSCNF